MVLSFDIWYVASPSGPLPRLFICCPWGQNWPRRVGGGLTSLKHRNKEGKLQNSSSLKLKSLIYGMKHLLVDLYQDCSYNAPGVKTGPAPGVTNSKHRNKDGKL